jgi:uncharacterized protein YndB with AHSA1/START domain
MSRGIVAEVSGAMQAPVEKVWSALVTPETIKKYMFGTQVVSDWKEGSPIVWKGEWKGKPYEDKGRILKLQPKKLLEYTHYSPLAGEPDVPESYHTVRIELSEGNGKTTVTLAQDNNKDQETKAHSEQNWKAMLEGLKKTVEAN